MRYYIKFYIFIIVLAGSLSCHKTLTEKSKSISAEAFYNTPAEVESAVNAIYEAVRATNGFGNLYLAQLEAYTDYSYGKGSYSMLTEFQGLDGTNITRVGQMWDQFYLTIRNANLVIANTPNGTELTDDQKNQYIAEARFLRGWVYFILVRNWGGVILRDETNMTEHDLPRTSAEQVYAFIVEDLKFASTHLPNEAAVAGKPSKWAAQSILSDVYFYQGEYKLARDLSKSVIESGTYKLVEVQKEDDFGKIYGPDVITTPEEIFYLKYSHDEGQGWTFMKYPHHPGDPYYNGVGIFGHYTDAAKNKFYKAWDDKDLRKSYNWFSWDIGLGATTMLNRKFRDPGRIYDGSNDCPVYRYADILLLYAEADARANNGPTVDAVEKLNMVRRRAYGYPSMTPSAVDLKLSDFNLSTFLDRVLLERGYETQYEGKRWLDLKRTGKLKEIIESAYGITVADKHLLWPIPESELNFNKALDPARDQNIGY